MPPYDIRLHFFFWLLYFLTDFFIQSDMGNPQWIRHHLSDVFAGPGIFVSYSLVLLVVTKKTHLMPLSPLLSLAGCIAYETLCQTPDPVDIWCYILGTIGFYLTCFLVPPSRFNFAQ